MDANFYSTEMGREAAVDHGVKEKSHSYWIIGILLPCYAVDQRIKVAKVS
ncbi:hypothetical protein T11_12422 [Trichinella zimbabwensis]|uniref:Uncharacterized protein n=1 Tax=Trichinella zimbabwensis TaxID=268475 RepID=A0A0V1H2E8_9BILA|nr:hypothetical protein T11_12422 [Trichinella zimbabwensis]